MLSTVRILGKRTVALSESITTLQSTIRTVTTINNPEYPSERDSELVNDEFFELMEDGAISELTEAVEEPSPVIISNYYNRVV